MAESRSDNESDDDDGRNKRLERVVDIITHLPLPDIF